MHATDVPSALHGPSRIPKKNSFTWVLAVLLAAGSATVFGAPQTISVDFEGRDSASGNPGTPALTADQIAGVLPVGNWNSIDNHYNADNSVANFIAAEQGTTIPLKDSTGAATPVTLTFDANDSWYNDVDITTIQKPNSIMMNG